MMRLGLALAGFWIVLGVVVVLVALVGDDVRTSAEEKPGALTCASLQKRAERCEDKLAELAGDLYAEHLKGQGESSVSVSIKRTVASSVVYNVIGEKQVAAYCKRYWDSKNPRICRARDQLAACFKKPGCQEFTDCLRALARRLDLTSF